MRYQLALLGAVAVAVSAQTTQTYKSSLDMTVDAGTVDPAERVTWCNAQYNTCDALCDDDSSKNDCVDETLEYNCKCASNNSAPGLQYYTQTMPTFICEKLYQNCIASADGTKKATDACTKNIQDLCGTLSPPAIKKTDGEDDDSATTTAASSTTEAASTASETAEAVTSTTSGGFAAPTLAPAGKGAAAAVAIGMLAYLV